jgi:hypothetical protein
VARKSEALKQVTAAANAADRAMLERDKLIRRAHKQGESIRTIAAAADLSPARVHQIVNSEPLKTRPRPGRRKESS